jgi:hypothetical protein
MDKTKLGLLGAVTALAALPAVSQAAATQPAVAPATSFAELLQPIPNALARLVQSDRELAGARLLQAQYNNHHHHHSNHHSRAWWNNYYRRHRSHHHHHNNHDHNHY